MDNTLIEKLTELVENACKSKSNKYGYGIWSHHIKPMLQISTKLASFYNADEEIVIIATLLHDLAGIRDNSKTKEHHIYGSIEAEEILRKYNYPDDRIEKVKRCILNHRGSFNNFNDIFEEICVADADAMAHIEQIGSLFYLVYKEMDMEIEEGIQYIKGKINRDWHKMSEKSKEIFKYKYESVIDIIK
ncbi:MAG: HD domain-containing protein [Clostridium sp.]